MWSLATMPGNRFVIPSSSRTGVSSMAPEIISRGRTRRSALETSLREFGRGLDLALDDQGLDLVHLDDERPRDLCADLADALEAVLERAVEVPATPEGAVLDRHVEAVGRDVDLLGAGRQDVRAEVGLVGVNPNPPHRP